ncbi:hypothetical protein BCR43DRAFT_508518 [Syncephalastrum racemosum]|uniref:Uncharacterized protein n=1 Tax=Syncephalastrum racemosum TaxID=13706 RepID=A0A1X2H0R5_SYNRA|nr:hypothetical protein BCR43DRAFT_508518 [Syncephalastrum racemosum]
MYMDLQLTIFELKDDLGLENFTRPWQNIDRAKQTTAVFNLEDRCARYGLRLDRCINSWAASQMIARSWGNKYQYAIREDAAHEDALLESSAVSSFKLEFSRKTDSYRRKRACQETSTSLLRRAFAK